MRQRYRQAVAKAQNCLYQARHTQGLRLKASTKIQHSLSNQKWLIKLTYFKEVCFRLLEKKQFVEPCQKNYKDPHNAISSFSVGV